MHGRLGCCRAFSEPCGLMAGLQHQHGLVSLRGLIAWLTLPSSSKIYPGLYVADKVAHSGVLYFICDIDTATLFQCLCSCTSLLCLFFSRKASRVGYFDLRLFTFAISIQFCLTPRVMVSRASLI